MGTSQSTSIFSIENFNIFISVLAIALSTLALWRDKFHFSGPVITLANSQDLQHSMVIPYRRATPAVRDQFPAYDEDSYAALVRAVWLNTGDRATYVNVKSVVVTGPDSKTYPCSFYNYVEVPANGAAIQLILLRDLPAETRPLLEAKVDFAWQRIKPRSAKLETGSGTIKVKTLHADDPRVADYPPSLVVV